MACTEDGGKTWRVVNAGLGQHTVLALTITPTTPSTLYAEERIRPRHTIVVRFAVNPVRRGTQDDRVFRSNDSGATWREVARARCSDNPVYALVIDPTAPTTVYAGTQYDGVLRSKDGGSTWSKDVSSGGGRATFVYAPVIDPSQPATIYAGTWQGVYRRVIESEQGWAPLP